MRRRTLLIAGAAVVALVGGAVAWRAIPYVPPAHETAQPTSVVREMAYVQRYWQHRNPAYGSFGGTDCVNFTSQALHARGWPMTSAWGTSVVLGRRAATPTWVSSTAMMRWLEHRPDLASVATAGEVQVGDVAQFDWDASGDRDHTAIVSGIVDDGGAGRVLEVAEHSPSGLHDDVDHLLAAHGGRGVVHYWHLKS